MLWKTMGGLFSIACVEKICHTLPLLSDKTEVLMPDKSTAQTTCIPGGLVTTDRDSSTENGASGGHRSRDLRLTRPLLYQAELSRHLNYRNHNIKNKNIR